MLLEKRFHQRQHRCPFAEQNDLAGFLVRQLLQHFIQRFEFARVARRLFVDEERTVAGHSSHQQMLLQSEQVHFGDVCLGCNLSGPSHMIVAQDFLLVGRTDANNLGCPFWQLLHDGLTSPSQQNRFQHLSQLVQILVARDLSIIVDHSMPMKKLICGAQPLVVHKPNDSKEFFESVLKWRSGEYQSKLRLQFLKDTCGLGFPIFNTLPFVQNDEVPFDLGDDRFVSHDLFIICDLEKAGIQILFGTLAGGAQNDAV